MVALLQILPCNLSFICSQNVHLESHIITIDNEENNINIYIYIFVSFISSQNVQLESHIITIDNEENNIYIYIYIFVPAKENQNICK